MDNKKLQEMKSRVKNSREISHEYYVGEITNDFLHELIAAYENQGELLRLSLANVDKLNEDAEMQHEIHVMLIEDAVSKYETAQAELAEKQKLADDFMKLMHDHIDDGVQLRKQLAEAQAEVERGHFGIGHKP